MCQTNPDFPNDDPQNNTSDVILKINYMTEIGQCLGVILHNKADQSPSWDFKSSGVPMICSEDGSIWTAKISALQKSEQYIYKYVVYENENTNIIRIEGHPGHTLDDFLPSCSGNLEVHDSWKDALNGPEKVFISSAFSEVLFRCDDCSQELQLKPAEEGKIAVVFEINHQLAKNYQKIMVSGSCKPLGSWNTDEALPLIRKKSKENQETLFTGVVYLDKQEDFPFEYKLFSLDTREEADGATAWEAGDTRAFNIDNLTDARTVVIRDPIPFRTEFKGMGVAVPVFSLRTKESLGVGEFADIRLLIDWAISAGVSLVQILPINSTIIHGSWRDSSPYSTFSAFALHPIYINIEKLDPPQAVLDIVNKNKEALNEEFLDYEKVLHLKYELLRLTYNEKKNEFLGSQEFKSFLEENKDWLPAFSLFCYFRDIYSTPNFNEWPEHRDITEDEIERLTSPSEPHYDSIAFEYYIQFQLSKQLTEISHYAKEKGVVLKGDLPIGVDQFSVDTWVNRKYFHTDFRAGAPPDDLCDEGHNWGFPTYNWEAMKESGYQWWKRRLEIMSRFFHAYRIDHILGFFRIWQSPAGCEGALLGYFDPAIPIEASELAENGMNDIERLVNPYVTWDHINEAFPSDSAQSIVERFFDVEEGSPMLRFKEEFSTERQILDALKPQANASKEEIEYNESLKQKLYNLLRNVVFLRDSKQNNAFHPRFNCAVTDSFACLPDDIKENINHLYHSYFHERQDSLWRKTAIERLGMMLYASNMMICGEDLGMIPGCVQSVMDELSIIGLRVQRMPKDCNCEFEILDVCPYMAVCSPSTHDTSSLRGWWEENRSKTQNYYRNILKESGDAPLFCETWIVEKIFYHHLRSTSMWVIFALQDIFAMANELRLHENPEDERVNEPADKCHYWRYRIPFTLEDLISNHASFTNKIKDANLFFGRFIE